MIVEFKYYLHESDHFESLQWALGNVDIELTEELYEKIGRPFYEVTLNCTLDTETGAVEILSAT